MTYRARLEGTSERDSDSLISLIEDWVRGGGASVIVTGILITVDPHCSVAISSLSEPECSPVPPVTPSASPSPTPHDTSRIMVSSAESCVCSDNTPAIIGGVVAIVIVVTTAGTIIAIVALVLKSRPQSIKKTSTERTAISTTTNTAYEMMKRGQEGVGGAPTVPQSSATGSVEEEKMYEMIPGENK